jgi:hypothetical protein
LGIHHAGGVEIPPREPGLGSGSPSFWEETCQMQMVLQDQERSGWTDQQMHDLDLCRNTMKYINTHKSRDVVEIKLHFINKK